MAVPYGAKVQTNQIFLRYLCLTLPLLQWAALGRGVEPARKKAETSNKEVNQYFLLTFPSAAQGEELEPARKKAEAAGVKEIYIDDLREEFVRDYVFPMFRCGWGLLRAGRSRERMLWGKKCLV